MIPKCVVWYKAKNWCTLSSLAIQATWRRTLKFMSTKSCVLLSRPLKSILMILRRAAWLSQYTLLSCNRDLRPSCNTSSLDSLQSFSSVWLEWHVLRMLELLGKTWAKAAWYVRVTLFWTGHSSSTLSLRLLANASEKEIITLSLIGLSRRYSFSYAALGLCRTVEKVTHPAVVI